jgi:TPR repeat protein
MKQDTALTRLTVVTDPHNKTSVEDRLLRTLQSSLKGQFELFGELGRGQDGRIVYLARELASGRLVALQLSPTGSKTLAGEDYWFEVVRTLDATIPAVDSDCPKCNKPLGGWARYCRHCGTDLGGPVGNESSEPDADLLHDVREVARGRYDVLGQMSRTEGGGLVYFARELATGKLVALRLQREREAASGNERYSLGLTGVLRSSVAEALGVGQAASAKKSAATAAVTQVAPKQQPQPVPEPLVTPVVLTPALAAPPPVSAVAPPRARQWATWRPTRPQAIGIGVGAVAIAVLLWSSLTRESDDDRLVHADPSVVDTTAPIASTILVTDFGEVQVAGGQWRGAQFRIDGERVSGSSVRVSAGNHTLSLSAPGHVTATQEVTIRAGQTLLWTPQLARVTAAAGTVEPNAPRPRPPVQRSTLASTPRSRTPVAAKPPAKAAAPYIDSTPPIALDARRADSASNASLTDLSVVSCASLFSRLEWSRALRTCEQEAKSGGVAAQRTVGTIYERGLGTQPSPNVASQWYARAADGGDAFAQFRLGAMLRSGTGVKKNEKLAVTWLRRAADQGHVDAMNTLARALERGEGVKRNHSEALALYTRAAELGSPYAQTKLGSLSSAGDIVTSDQRAAVTWFRKAADQGFAEAQYRLGDMYARGLGIAKSDAEARRWFALAAAQGHEQARKALRN